MQPHDRPPLPRSLNSDAEADSWGPSASTSRSEARTLAISIIKSPAKARNDSLLHDLDHMLRGRLGEDEPIMIEQTAQGLKIDLRPTDAGHRPGTGAGNAAAGA